MEVAPGIHRIVAPLGERFNALYLLAGRPRSAARGHGPGRRPRGTLAAVPGRRRASRASASGTRSTPTRTSTTRVATARIREHCSRASLLACGELDRPMVEDLERMIDRRYGEFAAPTTGWTTPRTTKDFIRERGSARSISGSPAASGFHLGDGWHVEVLHTPGHSWGSVSVWDPRSRALDDRRRGALERGAARERAARPSRRRIANVHLPRHHPAAAGHGHRPAAHQPLPGAAGPDVAEFLGGEPRVRRPRGRGVARRARRAVHGRWRS